MISVYLEDTIFSNALLGLKIKKIHLHSIFQSSVACVAWKKWRDFLQQICQAVEEGRKGFTFQIDLDGFYANFSELSLYSKELNN